jgi:predicted metal-dependent hydrolase
MASLDEVYEQMRSFQKALVDFNAEMRGSATALANSHQELCGLWRDEASQHYRQTYEPLAESLDDYLKTGAPRFENFLEKKVRQLERYLHGT